MPDERGAPRGFSLLELLIVIVIISVLGLVAIDRLLRLRFEAERVMVESMLSGLRSALYIEFAGAAARGRPDALAAAAGDLNGDTHPLQRCIAFKNVRPWIVGDEGAHVATGEDAEQLVHLDLVVRAPEVLPLDAVAVDSLTDEQLARRTARLATARRIHKEFVGGRPRRS